MNELYMWKIFFIEIQNIYFDHFPFYISGDKGEQKEKGRGLDS